MGLLSLFKQNQQKQETSPDHDNGEFHARADQPGERPRRGDAARKNKECDPALPEKKRARRRLTGALALVLAAVIGLPMVFDSEPKPLADDISIQIPSKDKALPASAAVAVPPPRAAAAATEEIVEMPPVNGKTQLPDQAAAPVSQAKSTATPLVLPEKFELKTEGNPKIDSKPDSTQNTATPVKNTTAAKDSGAKPAAEITIKTPAATGNDEAARALAILEGKTPPKTVKPENGTKSGYLIQVAALASMSKVHELQTQLQAQQISSHTQSVATTSGQIIRVRIGPYETREEADKMRAKLAKLGLSGNLVPN